MSTKKNGNCAKGAKSSGSKCGSKCGSTKKGK